MVRRIAEEEHSHDGACERDAGNVCLRRRCFVCCWIDPAEHRIYWTDDLLRIISFHLHCQVVLLRRILLSRWEMVAWRMYPYIVEIAITKQSSTTRNDRPEPFPSALFSARNAIAPLYIALRRVVEAIRLPLNRRSHDVVVYQRRHEVCASQAVT